MTLALFIAFLIAALAASWWLTGRVRRYALAQSILDIPNERSSHDRPVARGGGLAIAVVMLTGLVALWIVGDLDPRVSIALLGGGLAVAATGWIDDRRSVPAIRRALVHLLAAAWAVFWLDGMPTVDLGVTQIRMGLSGSVIAVLTIAWLLNLYNFMDGIDGIAASEAVTVASGGGILLLLSGQRGLAAAAFLVAAASAGFLAWNWPPAKIFMGDVGSGLLGFTFGVLAIASQNAGSVSVLMWALLLGVFVFDATVTLARRALRRERVTQPHRSHAYQRAVEAGMSHRNVTACVVSVNAVLFLCALLAFSRPTALFIALIAATILLVTVFLAVERMRPMTTMRRSEL